MKASRIFSIILFLVPFTLRAQQDVQINQYIFNYLYVNPAYAGYKEDFYAHSFYRNQWAGVKGAPETFALSVDGSVADEKVGLGLTIMQDNIGAQSNFQAHAIYAYRLPVGRENTLSFGLAAGVLQSGVDGSKLNPMDEADPYISSAVETALFPDIKAGIFYSSRSFFTGFSVTNILENGMGKTYQMVATPVPHYYLTAGGLLSLSDDVLMKPSILLKRDQKGITSADLNTLFMLREKFWLGVGLRSFYRKGSDGDQQNFGNNQLVAMAELFSGNKFRFGYAYEYSIAAASGMGSSHEISLGIYLRKHRETPMGKRCFF